MAVCSKCAKEAVLNSSKLCAVCNSFKVRLWRQLATFNDQDPQIARDFHSLSTAEKTVFWTDHHEMHGRDLALKILQMTSESRKTRCSHKFSSSGKGMDEDDIKKKYEGKDPDIVKNLFAHAFKF